MTQDPVDRLATVEPEESLVARILGDLSGSESAPSTGEKPPTLICVGGLHGNEPAGVEALKRVFARLEADPSCLVGRAVGLSGNRRALAARKRFLEDDLNRHWIPARVERLHTSDQRLRAENMELVELDRELQTLLDEAEGLVYFLDIHTTSGEGPARLQAQAGPDAAERDFGRPRGLPTEWGKQSGKRKRGTRSANKPCGSASRDFVTS